MLYFIIYIYNIYEYNNIIYNKKENGKTKCNDKH